jgi:hypothetical protein
LKRLLVLAVLAIALVSMAGAANYMYEKASVKGVGYKNVEMIISTQTGFNGQKLVEKESGSGNVITERTELEAERQLNRDGTPIGAKKDPEHYRSLSRVGIYDARNTLENYILLNPGDNLYLNDYPWLESIPMEQLAWLLGKSGLFVSVPEKLDPTCQWPTGINCPMDYINFTKEAEFEYMPVSYQTGTYDQKWIEKLCVQNYRIGAVLTEMYTHAEHLQKTTEVKTRGYGGVSNMVVDSNGCPPCCTGVLEANLNSNVIGVAHIGWLSRDPQADPQLKGRHAEYGRSVEDLTGVFSIEKFIQLWGNSTCGAISVDWLPCV